MESKLVVFKDKKIRRTLHNNEWWLVILDEVAALTDSIDPAGYIKDMRRRDKELAKGWGQFATPLSISTSGGKQRVNCANTEGIFRIIQSIPSPKAEPFKRWLAKVGYERVQEIKQLKGLARENLRDHMTDLELIFSMLGEAATTEIARKHDAQGFRENKTAAGKGGRIAGEAREKLEEETGTKVTSVQNYLTEPESRKRLKTPKEENKI
jgi:prophage antirepressor-like protein